MRVQLVFPPQWTAAQPYFGLAALNGQLRRAGHEVVIRDLNLELVEHALDPTHLSLAHKRLLNEAKLLTVEIGLRTLAADDASRAFSEARLKGLERYAEQHSHELEAIAGRAGTVARALRDPESYYDPRVHLATLGAMDAALEFFSISCFPSALRWNDFRSPTSSLNVASLVEICGDRRLNPFIRFYERKLPGLLEAEAGLIAISINSFSQIVPGLTLAKMIKEELSQREGPRPHLGIGGNFFGRLEETLAQKPEFFSRFTQSVAIGEGERTIVLLAEAVQSKDPAALEKVPNLLFFDEAQKRVRVTRSEPNYRMTEMARQELEGLPLDRYLAPERVVCLRASKGCYYGQCSFCDSYHGLRDDSVEVERVIEEMRGLRDRHGIRHFEFVDQCISPAYLGQLADGLIASKLGVRWFCNARTEPGFTPELLLRARQAGNTMLMWGIESGSPRLLKLMRKGIHPERRLEILKAASDAEIWNFAYVFFGFPTETAEEAEATIEMLRDNTELIHAYGRSLFTLGKHSPLVKNAEEHGILSIVEDDQELSTNLSYDVSSGLKPKDLPGVSARCFEVCRKAYGDEPLWMALRSREALHLYLAHHGKQFVQHFRFRESSAGEGAEFIF